MSPQCINVAILECDRSLDRDRNLYGGYGGLVKSWLNSHDFFRGNTSITIWDVCDAREYPKPGTFDVLFITGSVTSAESGEPWVEALLQFLSGIVNDDANETRILGVCFGHQVIGKVLGSVVTRSSSGFESSLTEIQLTAEGASLFGRPTLNLYQMHSDHVLSAPSSTVLLGSTEHTKVQGLYKPKRFLTIQAHPEFDRGLMDLVYDLMEEHGDLTKAEVAQGKAKVAAKTDADVVLDAFARFLVEGY